MDQEHIADFLARPESHGLGPDAHIACRETHVSRLFLGPEFAYKLKRPVKFPYLDFSTLDQREAACRTELEINQRTAPDIYLDVVPVTLDGDCLGIDGVGEVVDWLVKMRRFDDAQLFDKLADRGALHRRLMEGLADEVAAAHVKAPKAPGGGGRTGTRLIVENNHASFLAAPAGVFERRDVEALLEGSRALLNRVGDQLEQRRQSGRVRHCHGDLHLGNICLLDGAPLIFDAIEFNTEFAHIDTFYDLAFLLMDMDFRGLRNLAAVVLNQYLDRQPSGGTEAEALSLLPLFLSMRAAIRAHVGAQRMGALSDPVAQDAARAEARAYLDQALGYISPEAPCLVAVGGLSGSGKSRVAREVASHLGPPPGARIVRTDAVRKQMWGVALEEKLPPQAYKPDVTRQTYDQVEAEVRSAVAAGQAAIFDGVNARPEDRRRIEAIADDLGVPFSGLWIDAPLEVRLERVTSRQSNVSDADAEVARQQANIDPGEITWHQISSVGSKDDTVARALKALGR